MDRDMLLKHLNILYDSYKENYKIQHSLVPQHTNVNKYRDLAAEVKILIAQVQHHLPIVDTKTE